MNKAGLAAISLNERLKSIKGDFVCLITEPYNFKGKAASLPSNAQVVPENTEEKASRAIIIASPNCEIVEVSNLCSKDSAETWSLNFRVSPVRAQTVWDSHREELPRQSYGW